LSQFGLAVAVCREGPRPDRSWRAAADGAADARWLPQYH